MRAITISRAPRFACGGSSSSGASPARTSRIDPRIWDLFGESWAVVKHASAAVRCAIEMQNACKVHNATRSPEEKVLLCIGIGFGRILRIGDTDVYRQEVNAASKLGEDTAKADEILVTDAVRVAAEGLKGVRFEPIDQAVPGSATNFRIFET